MVLGSSPAAFTSPSDFAPASSKEFLDILGSSPVAVTVFVVVQVMLQKSPSDGNCFWLSLV